MILVPRLITFQREIGIKSVSKASIYNQGKDGGRGK